METESLQDRYAPAGRCFGCGPANEQGLRIKSRVEGEELVADWTPQPHHLAFEGVLNGGICSTLLDCHANWTAAWTLMRARGADTPPTTVTSELAVKLHRPTPVGTPLRLRAHPVEVAADRVVVEGSIESNGKVTATCRATFVAVKEGHPAYNRW